MNENIETVVDETTETVTDTEKETTETETETTVDEADNEVATFTEEEVSKKVQSECDKLRSGYAKKIKKLEDKIAELSPVKKSETELELERRLSELEKTQKELDAQKSFMTLQESLQSKGIDKSLASYLKDDVDVDGFTTAFESVVKEVTKSNAYVPDTHNAGDKITVEEFSKMKYSEKVEIMNKSPELYKRLMAKIKN